MKRVLAVGAISFVLAGCASSFPGAPEVRTEKGIDCVSECQREDSFCVSSCESVVTGMADDSSPCITRCRKKLEECYARCAEEDQKP